MRRFLSGIGSLLILLILAVGIPVALIALAGNPIPPIGDWSQLFGRDFGGHLFINSFLPVVGWVAWLSFMIAVIVELPSQLRGIDPPRLRLIGLQQQGAAALIGAVLVMFTGFSGAIVTPAAAQADAPPVVASVSADFAPHAAAATPTAGSAEAAAPTPVVDLPTYTVGDGDSLWNIAEQQLGDGRRYPEIAQLNYGVQQADGHALTDDHWLNAGWVLQLPADAAAASPAATPSQHVVGVGENLWEVAQSLWGDGDRYMELFNANQGRIQADGQSLEDPAILRPGWVLDIPGAAVPTPPAPAVSAPAPTPAPVPEQASVPIPPAATAGQAEDHEQSADDTSPTPSSTTSESSTSHDVVPSSEQEDDDESWADSLFTAPWQTTGGIGGVLAAGLLTVLGLRRLKQRRQRRPGQRISMPTEDISSMELELRAVENPFDVDDVDHALRLLAVWAQDTNATLPQLYAIRLAESEIALYLDSAADLPEPFESVSEDKKAWVVNPTEFAELDRIPSAPYPALVTLGHDETNAQILVDLEHLGALNIVGDDQRGREALTALAIELTTSRWADDLQITLVGIAEGLPDALDTGRIRHVNDIDALLRDLRAQAADAERTLKELKADSIEQARSSGEHAEGWTPEIVILGELPEQAARDELADLVSRLPRVGIAAISHGHLVGEWTLRVAGDRTAVLNPLGLPLTPQTVTEEEYRKILALFKVTDMEPVEGPTWAKDIDQNEIALDDIPEATSSATMPVAEALGDEEDDWDWKGSLHRVLAPATAPTGEDPATSAEVDPPRAEAPEIPVETATAASEHPALLKLRQGPYVQLLGNVEVIGARGPAPKSAQSSYTRMATELIAFLALNRGGLTETAVSEAIWPLEPPQGKKAEQNRNALTSRARRWLGSNEAEDRYLPKVGTQGYRVENLPTDWEVWLEVIGEDLTKTPTADLITALQLVHGAPIAGVKAGRYNWAELPEKSRRSEMVQSIGDVAHELASRSLRAGDYSNARLAATVGRIVDPVNETFWRAAIKAEYQAHEPLGIDRIIAEHTAYINSFGDGYELEDETAELIRQVREHRETIAG